LLINISANDFLIDECAGYRLKESSRSVEALHPSKGIIPKPSVDY